jgi:L-threonine kinase
MRLLEEPLLTADRIAEAATISALANQFILPKDGLADILTAAKAAGALGLDVAHSGTVIGILFAPGSPEASIDAAIRQLSAKFPYLSYLRTAHLVPGGFQIAEQGGTA